MVSIPVHQQDLVVKCRGLPWSCTENDLKIFFQRDDLKTVFFATNQQGRMTGECYVEFHSDDAYRAALAKDKESMGKRYIEIFPVKRSEMEYGLRHSADVSRYDSLLNLNSDCIVRLRGLPHGCWEEDIMHFFSGLEIVPDGILMCTDDNGKLKGEAFVQFSNPLHYEEALKKNKQHIGHRYIEVFRSSYDELEHFMYPEFDMMMNMSPYGGRGGRYGAGGRSRGGAANRMDMMMMGAGGGRYGAGPPFGARGRMYGAGGGGFGPYGMGGGYGALGMRRGIGAYGGDMMGGYDDSMMMMGGGYSPMGKVTKGGGAEKPLKHHVMMKGLPYKCGQEEIVTFFSPIRIAGVQFKFDTTGKPSGEATAEFFTHADAVEAMKRDKALIENRYIELFLSSETTDDDDDNGMDYSTPISKPAVNTYGQQQQQQQQQQAADPQPLTSVYTGFGLPPAAAGGMGMMGAGGAMRDFSANHF